MTTPDEMPFKLYVFYESKHGVIGFELGNNMSLTVDSEIERVPNFVTGFMDHKPGPILIEARGTIVASTIFENMPETEWTAAEKPKQIEAKELIEDAGNNCNEP